MAARPPTSILIGHGRGVVISGLRQLLPRGFAVVDSVRDGRLLLAAAKRTTPDVLIVDLGMPNMNGIHVARELRARVPGVRILVLSLYFEPRLAAHVLRAGAKGFVLERSADAEILDALATVATGGRFISRNVSASVETTLRSMRSGSAGPLFRLTPRQREVVELLGAGRTIKQVAVRLGISARTAETHKYQAMNALGADSTIEMVQNAVRLGIIGW